MVGCRFVRHNNQRFGPLVGRCARKRDTPSRTKNPRGRYQGSGIPRGGVSDRGRPRLGDRSAGVRPTVEAKASVTRRKTAGAPWQDRSLSPRAASQPIRCSMKMRLSSRPRTPISIHKVAYSYVRLPRVSLRRPRPLPKRPHTFFASLAAYPMGVVEEEQE
jgi:hypothetical protein